MMMRWLLLLPPVIGLAACGRPPVVRSVASAALPVATTLKTSATAQQNRFALQRDLLDGRANELAQQAALARSRASEIELDWKFAPNPDLPKKLAMFRDGDAAILADPLRSVATDTTLSSKPAPLDLGSLNNVVSGFDRLRAVRPLDGAEIFAFFVSVNAKLGEISDAAAKPQPASKPDVAQ